MTPNQFRRIALSLKGSEEGAHQRHPDFRAGGRIFATLGYPDVAWAMVKLTGDQRALLTTTTPAVFVPLKGAWGRGGATNVRLAAADQATVKRALRMAWENVAARSSTGRKIAKPAQRSDAPRERTSTIDRAFARALRAAKATKLPGIEQSKSYGTPSLTVLGKFLMRVKDADTLVFRCAMEEKQFLMEAEPSIYFETDHYVGWPAVLMRVASASDAELAHCVRRAWQLQAPKKLRAEQQMHSAPAGRKSAKRS
jgi:hypothetical protein